MPFLSFWRPLAAPRGLRSPSNLRRLSSRTAGAALLSFAVAFIGIAAATPAAQRDTTWDELVPKGWNPMANFKMPPGLGMFNDSDPRVLEMMRELREVWDNAPTRTELDGSVVRLSGYVVPLEQMKGEVKEFLLVPYFGACIHTPPPPANQIVHVFPMAGDKSTKGLRTMDVVTVQGTLRAARGDSAMGASGYRIDEAAVRPYVSPPAAPPAPASATAPAPAAAPAPAPAQ